MDAARLGLLCGPSSGLSLLAAASGAVGEEGPTLPFRWEAEPGECFRVVAAAGEGALDVALTVELPGGGHLLAATGNRWAIVPADGLICPAAGRPLTLRVRTHAGRGRAALEIWRGRGLAAESLVPDPRAHPAAASSGAIPRVDAPPRTHSLH
ncbi:MAG: hypothetical protein FJ104_14660 [Deltaproteobacteria bacterium]|nr:hypothetical protein [Deltaproteobacteria bacterium]